MPVPIAAVRHRLRRDRTGAGAQPDAGPASRQSPPGQGYSCVSPYLRNPLSPIHRLHRKLRGGRLGARAHRLERQFTHLTGWSTSARLLARSRGARWLKAEILEKAEGRGPMLERASRVEDGPHPTWTPVAAAVRGDPIVIHASHPAANAASTRPRRRVTSARGRSSMSRPARARRARHRQRRVPGLRPFRPGGSRIDRSAMRLGIA